jgi:protein tyrosine phosphatase (PTP) superfamily phosphohydrolase (DUF442 family)
MNVDAENTHQVFDWLWSSGQLSEADIDKLRSLGVEAVINLALPTSVNALHGEAELITGRGIAYIQIPVLFDQPRLHQLQQFFAALSMFEGRKVWVHCAKNMRVSAFIYLYRRLRLKQSEAEASYPMREVWEPDPTWRAFIDDALAALSSTGSATGPE